MIAWTASHVGIPHAQQSSAAALNCWGIVTRVYASELGIVLPSYAGRFVCLEEQAEIAALFAEEAGREVWQKVDRPAPFDVLTFRTGRYVTHVGLFVSAGRMLHAEADDQSRLERFDTPLWTNRLSGIYRHVEAATKVAA